MLRGMHIHLDGEDNYRKPGIETDLVHGCGFIETQLHSASARDRYR
jgi:hypothetical protein